MPDPVVRNITIVKGRYYAHVLTFNDALSRAGFRYRAQVRRDPEDTGTPDAEFSVDSSSTADANVVVFMLSADQTEAIPGSHAEWDIEEIDEAGRPTSVVLGDVKLVQGVTH